MDDASQRVSSFADRYRRTERDLSELLGLAKGMLSDGIVNQAEVNYLQQWGRGHADALGRWPTRRIFSRLARYCADGRIDDRERVELKDLFDSLVDGTASLLLGYERATTLPLDDPAPAIYWGPNEVYVFTGRFAYGTQADCEREVIERGANVDAEVTRRTTFLVIGAFGPQEWSHSLAGRKIRQAVDLRADGCPLCIVGEDHWARAL